MFSCGKARRPVSASYPTTPTAYTSSKPAHVIWLSVWGWLRRLPKPAFRTQVRRRAEHLPGHGEIAMRRFGDPEVVDLDLARRREQDVRGFDVETRDPPL